MVMITFVKIRARVAQLAEQLTFNQRVLGSSPSARTNDFNKLGEFLDPAESEWQPNSNQLIPFRFERRLARARLHQLNTRSPIALPLHENAESDTVKQLCGVWLRLPGVNACRLGQFGACCEKPYQWNCISHSLSESSLHVGTSVCAVDNASVGGSPE